MWHQYYATCTRLRQRAEYGQDRRRCVMRGRGIACLGCFESPASPLSVRCIDVVPALEPPPARLPRPVSVRNR
jgi:hypothetical protein